jgi:hypothetical protein
MAGHLQILVPGVRARLVDFVRMARSKAGWDKEQLDPRTLGVKSNEQLQYMMGGTAGMQTDDESVNTIVVAVSDPYKYGGGKFALYDSNAPPADKSASSSDACRPWRS